MKPWEPQKGESMPAYQAWCCFLEMGDERSTRAVAQRLGKSDSLISRWSSRWGWVERIASYEAYMQEIEQKAREKALTKKAEDWATKELEMAALLYDKAKSMLAFPLAKQTTKDGKTVVMPADWRMRDAASIAEAGVKMERLARGEPTDRVAVVEAARAAFGRIRALPNISEARAVEIVAETFPDVSEQELVIDTDRVM